MFKTQSGNILFIILLSIALFAGLTYAVVQSSRQNISIMNEQEMKIHFNEIMNYATRIQTAYARLQTMKGCQLEQISVYHPAMDNAANINDFQNANAPADEHCHLFSSNGGRVPVIAPPRGARVLSRLDGTKVWFEDYYIITNENRIHQQGDPAKTEILLLMPHIKPEFCDYINKRQNIENSSTTDLVMGKYDASFGPLSLIGDGSSERDVRDNQFGCIRETGSGTAGDHFYYIVAIR